MYQYALFTANHILVRQMKYWIVLKNELERLEFNTAPAELCAYLQLFRHDGLVFHT